jgi:hypothetical protein
MAVVLLCVLANISLAADPPTTMPLGAPDADGFISLFNGRDLSGWDGMPGYWTVKDGAITGSQTRENSKHTFLILGASKAEPEKFANFELQLKYRWSTTTGNSGVQFRSKLVDPATWKVGGYQADIDPPRRYDGGLYDEASVAGQRGIMASRGAKTTWDKENVRKNEPLGKTSQELMALVHEPNTEWNSMDVVANGNHITVTVNGVLMGDIIDESPKALKDGLIALQLHTGQAMTIQFKDLRIKLLDAPKNP